MQKLLAEIGAKLTELVSQRWVILATLAAFSGWIYIQSYLTVFGLSPASLSISPQSFAYYSFRPYLGGAIEHPMQLLCWIPAVLLIVAVALLASRFVKADSAWRTIIVYIALFAIAISWSQNVANLDARALARGGGTRVQLILGENFHKQPGTVAAALRVGVPTDNLIERQIQARLLQANQSGHLRVVWRNNESLVVVETLTNAFSDCSVGDPSNRLPEYCAGNPRSPQVPFVYVISTGEIVSLRTLRVSGATGTGVY